MFLRFVLIILVRYSIACQRQPGNPKLPEGNGRIFYVDHERRLNIRGDFGGDEEFKMTVGRSVECGSDHPNKTTPTKSPECFNATGSNDTAYELQEKCGERNYWCAYDRMEAKKYPMEICVDKQKNCTDGFVLCYERYRPKNDRKNESETLWPAPVADGLRNNTPDWVKKCSDERLWAWRVWTNDTELLFDVTENYMKAPQDGRSERDLRINITENNAESDNGTRVCVSIDDSSTTAGFAPGQRNFENFTRMDQMMRFPLPYFEVKLKAYSVSDECGLNIRMVGRTRECAVRWELIGGCSNIAPTKLSTEPYKCTYQRTTGVTRVQQYGTTSMNSQTLSSTNTNGSIKTTGTIKEEKNKYGAAGFEVDKGSTFTYDLLEKLWMQSQTKSGTTRNQLEQLSIDSVTEEKSDQHEFAVGAGESKVVKQLIMECDWFTIRTPQTQLVQGAPSTISKLLLSVLIPMIALA